MCNGFSVDGIFSKHNRTGLPKEWVETVCEENRRDFDLRGLGEKLLTVRV